MTQLSVYFGRLETTEIFQSPSMTPTNWVGNVGGLLGKLNLSFNLLINSVSNRPIPWIQLTFVYRDSGSSDQNLLDPTPK